MIFEPGDKALLTDRRGRRYLLTLRPGASFHFHRGIVQHDAILGQPDGIRVTSTGSESLTVFHPTYADYVLKMPRGAQVIYPKDVAIMLMQADIYPGARVLEAGIGSGATTIALLRSIGPEGRVTAYEQREDFAERARANITEFLGKAENLEVRMGSIYEPIEPTEFDRAVLDLPEPWRALPQIEANLRPGGILVCFLPTILQVHRLTEELAAQPRWTATWTQETLTRSWHIEGQSVRPDHRMVAHTGFLTLARLLTE
ncbi:MAG TPA: tRNA (adenine-N1)-methyltransferase [Actinomycetota bacterium]|nr:tRNA (adenine-N1)-methyltransferase [Actinomycetota bacterium]